MGKNIPPPSTDYSQLPQLMDRKLLLSKGKPPYLSPVTTDSSKKAETITTNIDKINITKTDEDLDSSTNNNPDTNNV